MPQRDETPRDLLFGLLALQNGLIAQEQLLDAFRSWMLAKGRTLAELLIERGAIDAETRALLAGMAAKQLKLHGGDAEKSLASIAAGPSTLEKLDALTEKGLSIALPSTRSTAEDPYRTASHVLGDPDRTAGHAFGSSKPGVLRFRILRPHAKGGLGAVYVAVDGELNREVALKEILDRHADNPSSRARFLVEAEITGGLEHPGIVPVYGLGHYDDGRPYYAMRFIRGDSLREAIAAFHDDPALKGDPGKRSLALRKLLRRFVDVCNAIDYAHGRGVLHRDIKPSNVILGKHGETLVVDWGLAKPMGSSDRDSDLDERILMPSASSGSGETLPGTAIGTPSYMSPEQAVGDLGRLGPRSDIYSLGATLYSLLTGKAPFEGNGIGEVLREVQKGAFPPPRQVDPSIDKALEAVCLKAMATNPGNRHATARALADDVERWSADEPTSAYVEPASVRARRWMRRNRTPVAAAAVALVAGMVGLAAVLAVQTRAKNDLARANGKLSEALGREEKANVSLATSNAELTRSRAAVEERYDLAVAAIKTFHTGVSEDFLLKQDQFKELRDRLLKSAADFYGKLATLLGRVTNLATRRALARSNYELANLTDTVGRKEDALAAHRAVLAMRQDLSAGPEAGPEDKEEVGRSLTAIANLLEATGRQAEALAAYRQAEALLAGQIEADPSIRASLAICRAGLARLLRATGKEFEALEAYRLARLDQETLAAGPEASKEARRDLAATINRIAAFLFDAGKMAEAEADYRTSLAIRRKLAEDHPNVLEFRSSLTDSHNNLGLLMFRTGRLAEAESECRLALAIRRKLAEEQPAVAEFRVRLANSHNGLGDLLSRQGRVLESEAEHRQALSIYRKLADDHPTVTEFSVRLADTHNGLGGLLTGMGRLAEAEAECRQALAIHRTLVDENPTVEGFRGKLAESHNGLGSLLARTGRAAEAGDEYRRAVAILGKMVDDNPRVPEIRNRLAANHNDLSDLARRLGRPAEARDGYDRAIALREALALEVPKVTRYRGGLAWSLRGRSMALLDLGELAGAAADVRRALALWEGILSRSGDEWFEMACGHAILAGLAGREGSGISLEAAEPQADQAMDRIRKALGMGYRDAGSINREIALDPLRSRADFRLLMLDLAFPADVFAR